MPTPSKRPGESAALGQIREVLLRITHYWREKDANAVETARRIAALGQAREALLRITDYWREKADDERALRTGSWTYQARSYCFAAAAERLKINMEMFARRLHYDLHDLRAYLRYYDRVGSQPNAFTIEEALKAAGGDRAVAARHLRIAALGRPERRAGLEAIADVLHPSRHKLPDSAEHPRLVRLRRLLRLWTPNTGRWWGRKDPDPVETATRWITTMGQARDALLHVAGADTSEVVEDLAEIMMLLAYHISADLEMT